MASDLVSSNARSQVRAHIERELGKIKQSFQPAQSTVEVLLVPSTDERPVQTLITCGMSDRPMNTGGAADTPQYLELMMTLPRQWKLAEIPEQDPGYWPIRLLSSLARLPFERDRSLKWGDTIANGDPPKPYATDTQLCGVILAPSLLVPKEFYSLDAAGRHVEFYAAIPLYKEELELSNKQGMKQLLTTLIDHNVNDLVDVKRRNVARKRFGFWN
jgi:hypothetical protein